MPVPRLDESSNLSRTVILTRNSFVILVLRVSQLYMLGPSHVPQAKSQIPHLE